MKWFASQYFAAASVGSLFFLTTMAGATPIVISTNDGQGADTYIQSTIGNSAPFTNFGNSGGMVLKNGPTPNQFARKGYLRFDLSGVSGSVDSALLELTIAANDAGGGNPAPSSFTLDVFGLNDGIADFWVEGNGGTNNDPVNEIVWNNAPANDTSSGIGLIGGEVSLLGQFNVTTSDVIGTTVAFASNPDFVSFINADSNDVATFILRRTAGGSNNLSFRTKEFGIPEAPLLTLNVVPEPSSFALTLFGLAMLFRTRRNV